MVLESDPARSKGVVASQLLVDHWECRNAMFAASHNLWLVGKVSPAMTKTRDHQVPLESEAMALMFDFRVCQTISNHIGFSVDHHHLLEKPLQDFMSHYFMTLICSRLCQSISGFIKPSSSIGKAMSAMAFLRRTMRPAMGCPAMGLSARRGHAAATRARILKSDVPDIIFHFAVEEYLSLETEMVQRALAKGFQ